VHSKCIISCSSKRCNFFCTDHNILEIHVKRHHPELKNLKKYQCSKCSFYCYTKLALKNHKLLKHGTANFRCHFCPEKRYKSKLSIKNHITLIHSYFKACCHCKLKISEFSFKCHSIVRKCQYCSKSSPCKFTHGKHERECVHRRNEL